MAALNDVCSKNTENSENHSSINYDIEYEKKLKYTRLKNIEKINLVRINIWSLLL